MFAIFKRELRSYFTSLVGYVVIGVMLAVYRVILLRQLPGVWHVGFFNRFVFYHAGHAVFAAGADHAQLCG